MPEFYIENISLPPAVEAVLDKRTSMGIAGDLGKYSQFAAAEAMTAAAHNTNSAMGAGHLARGAWHRTLAHKRPHRHRWNTSGILPTKVRPPAPIPKHALAAW
jgi:hypothetical protein